MFKKAHKASGIPNVLNMPDGQTGVSAKARATAVLTKRASFDFQKNDPFLINTCLQIQKI